MDLIEQAPHSENRQDQAHSQENKGGKFAQARAVGLGGQPPPNTDKQRKGRAGRTQPGVCYRLWSQADQFSLADYSAPEITTADLAPLVLELAQWGARDPNDLNWIDPPPAAHWQQAVSLLQWLDLLDHRGAITAHGTKARNLGCHPRLAHMVLLGRIMGWPVLAAELAVWALQYRLFEGSFRLHGWVWAIFPLLSAILLALFGRWQLGPVLNVSPMLLLRRLED